MFYGSALGNIDHSAFRALSVREGINNLRARLSKDGSAQKPAWIHVC